MDPYLANLNFDPPKHSSELALGLLPALVLNALFFGVVLLGAQPELQQPGSSPTMSGDTSSLTREMGGPPAPAEATPPAAQQSTTAPAQPIRQAPAARAPVTSTQVAKVEAKPAAARPAPAAPRVSPSFDCGRARLKTEKLICGDAELSQLDRDLGRLYAQAKAAAPDRSAFQRESDRAWARREAECSDKGCLERWYAERRAQLQADLAGRRQATGNPSR
ncbi:lysozyme inhibitor LprI family protein [Ramlibacter algicola]|uniref:DUF1311 domain-containing protein n=1 Tax=Ramlibacter algicola TaxID=2795217 RepID=A0A934UTC6_9BURK|nr:hypothetical protein [Ramlibacter algicola]MBK0394796.1 hypothetical protein [Ramlibacter algicola]